MYYDSCGQTKVQKADLMVNSSQI